MRGEGLGEVDFVGTCNERVIFKAYYLIGDEEKSEILIVHNGEYHFRAEGSMLRRFWFNEQIPDFLYEQTYKHIIYEVNRWCEDLGLPTVKEPTREEILKY